MGTETTCSIHRLYHGFGNWNSIPGRGRNFLLLHGVQSGPMAHPVTYSLGNESFFFRWQSGWNVNLTNSSQLVPGSNTRIHGMLINGGDNLHTYVKTRGLKCLQKSRRQNSDIENVPKWGATVWNLLFHARDGTLIQANTKVCRRFIYIYIYRPSSWSSGQGLWLLIMRSRVRFPVLPWEFFLAGKDSRGDHGLGC